MNEEEIIAADTASISILSMTDKRVSLQNIRKRTAAVITDCPSKGKTKVNRFFNTNYIPISHFEQISFICIYTHT